MTNLTEQVRKVLPGEEIEVSMIKNILKRADLLESDKVNIELQQFSSGYSNLTYLIKAGNFEYVLRRPPFGAIKRGHDMGREYRVLNALNNGYAKVPKVYLFDEKEILGVPFYLMEKVNGIILNMKECKKRKPSETEFGQISQEWLDTFVELHHLDHRSMGLENFGRPEGYVSRQVSNWSKQYLKAKTKEVPAAEKVMKWMADKQCQSSHSTLIHNDFRYDNVIFSDDSWSEVKSVLDWEMSTIGDPLMDLGTTLGYWTISSDPEFVRQGLPSPTTYPGNWSRTGLVEAYESRTGKKINNIIFYYVYGLFKIAVIAQQIYFRYDKGLTKDPKFAGLESASEGLCNMALQAIQKKRLEDLF